jgi:hypothetical protein
VQSAESALLSAKYAGAVGLRFSLSEASMDSTQMDRFDPAQVVVRSGFAA